MNRFSKYLFDVKAFVLLVAIVAFLLFKWLQPSPTKIDTVDDVKLHLDKAGFYCQILFPKSGSNLVVSEQPISDEDAKEFACFIGSSIRSHSGKVLVRFDPECFKPNHPTRSSRTWGKLWAAGDPLLLDRLETIIGLQ